MLLISLLINVYIFLRCLITLPCRDQLLVLLKQLVFIIAYQVCTALLHPPKTHRLNADIRTIVLHVMIKSMISKLLRPICRRMDRYMRLLVIVKRRRGKQNIIRRGTQMLYCQRNLCLIQVL